MASTVENLENSRIKLTLDISVHDFEHAMEFAFNRNSKRFAVPGFRKGKAPMQMVIRYYGEGVLYEDAIDHAFAHAYGDAIKEHDLQVVSQPEIDIEEIGLNKGLKMTAIVTVKPEVVLGQYKGVEAVKPDSEVNDEQVEAELKRIQERNSRMVPVEGRPVEDGDTANINYEGFKDGVAFEGGQADDHDLRIGSGSFIPGFEEQIIGHNVGDEFDVELSFPEDYHEESLAGEAVVFKVKINSIKVKELPELDDEFAKDVSEFETLDEYRESLRAKQAEQAAKTADSVFENNVVKAVTANASIDVPEVMVENEMDNMVTQQDQQMRSQGLTLEQYLGYLGQSMNDFREQYRELALERVKTSLTLEAISNVEAIEVDEEAVDQEIAALAAQYGMTADQIKGEMGDDDFDYLRRNAKVQKAVDLIKEAAIAIPEPEVSEVEALYNELDEEAKEEVNAEEEVETEEA